MNSLLHAGSAPTRPVYKNKLAAPADYSRAESEVPLTHVNCHESWLLSAEFFRRSARLATLFLADSGAQNEVQRYFCFRADRVVQACQGRRSLIRSLRKIFTSTFKAVWASVRAVLKRLSGVEMA